MSKIQMVWSGNEAALFLERKEPKLERLDNVVYQVNYSDTAGLYLTKVSDKFEFNYKIYGLETKLINRVVHTYTNTTYGNIGILLNGLKGTGKTVSSKLIANQLNQPIILVSGNYPNVTEFLNSIPQNITVFVDEYEKIFNKSHDLLTIMDGALNSEFRRVFILTTNELRIDENLLQRPSRVRYLKEFSDLTPSVIEEIVDDLLINKTLKEEIILFISQLNFITVDIVKSILAEVNMYNESPEYFADVFNVRKNLISHEVYEEIDDEYVLKVRSSTSLSVIPPFMDKHIEMEFEDGWSNFGEITKVISEDSIEVIKNDKTRKLKVKTFIQKNDTYK